MTDSRVDAHTTEGVRYLTLNNPSKLNVLDRGMLQAVIDHVNEAAKHDIAVVFTGAGDRSFSAGMHLDSFNNLDPAAARDLISKVGAMLAAVRTCPIPTIASINGYCLGAAFELALVCDLRIAASDATVGLPEVKVGIPSVLDASLLSQYVGLGLAKEIILTGDLYAVDQLSATTLFNRIVRRSELRSVVNEYIGKFRPLSRRVITGQKALFENWINVAHTVGVDLSIREFAAMFEHPETGEHIERARRSTGARRY